MKKTVSWFTALGAASALALCLSLTAQGQDTGPYFKGDLGGTWTQDLNLRDYFGVGTPGAKVRLDPGVRAGVAGGYQFVNWFAAEAELGAFENRIKSIDGASRVHDAWFANVPLLLNAKFQLPNRTPFTPYLGAGVGFSESIIDVGRISIGNIDVHGDDAETVFAYQAFAGVRCALNERMGLSLEYRYFAADGASWDADFRGPAITDAVKFGHVQTHAISVAFDFRF